MKQRRFALILLLEASLCDDLLLFIVNSPSQDEPEDITTLTMDEIEVKKYVGGLVKSFERKAV